MTKTETIRVFKSDKKRIQEIAGATGMNTARVVAEMIREPAYVCPECGDPFDPAEIDRSTVEEHGLLTTGVDKLVKGQRDVKSFECPCCGERVQPGDIETADVEEHSGVAARDMGVTSENEEQEISTEEA